MSVRNLLLLLFTLFITNVYANIVYVSVNQQLDPNGANNTASFTIQGKNLNLSFWSFGASGFQIDGTTAVRGAVIGTTRELQKFSSGTLIDGTKNYASEQFAGFAPAYYGGMVIPNPQNSALAVGDSAYLGFRIVDGANTYYGWLKITHSANDVITINEYAYENVSGVGIAAGSTGATGNIQVASITVQGAGGASTITTASGTLQMEATVMPANASNNTVTWSVANGTGSATISSTGLLTAAQNGTVTVTATANDGSNVSGNTTITISGQAILVTNISVQGAGGASTITTSNGTLQMEATVLPANATNSNVTWSLTNITGSATISNTGLLTAMQDGTVLITATAADGSGIFGSTVITISGQMLGLKHLSTMSGEIYPNPCAADFIMVKVPKNQIVESVEVYTFDGRLMQQYAGNSSEEKIDVSELDQGFYYINVYVNGGQSFSKKIVLSE